MRNRQNPCSLWRRPPTDQRKKRPVVFSHRYLTSECTREEMRRGFNNAVNCEHQGHTGEVRLVLEMMKPHFPGLMEELFKAAGTEAIIRIFLESGMTLDYTLWNTADEDRLRMYMKLAIELNILDDFMGSGCDGLTALHFAAQRAREGEGIFEVFLENAWAISRALPDKETVCRILYTMEIQDFSVDICQTIVDFLPTSFDWNPRAGCNLETPLMWLVDQAEGGARPIFVNGDLARIQAFIAAGANPSLRDASGKTALDRLLSKRQFKDIQDVVNKVDITLMAYKSQYDPQRIFYGRHDWSPRIPVTVIDLILYLYDLERGSVAPERSCSGWSLRTGSFPEGPCYVKHSQQLPDGWIVFPGSTTPEGGKYYLHTLEGTLQTVRPVKPLLSYILGPSSAKCHNPTCNVLRPMNFFTKAQWNKRKYTGYPNECRSCRKG